MFVLGVGAALLASAMFNVGLALQALEARKASKSLGMRFSLLWQLLRRRRWLLGQVLGTVGIGPQLYALSVASFVIVQPLLAVGLLLLLAIGAEVFDEPVGTLAYVGVIAIVAGVALVAWGAPPHSETHRDGVAVIAVAALVAGVALLPFAVRRTKWDSSTLLMIAAGCGFAGTNIATKLLGDDFGLGHYLVAAGWGVFGLGLGVAATVTGMSAFQRRRATIVVPVTTAVQTYLPLLLEPLFLRERWGAAQLGGVPIVTGVLIALVGTVLVTRTDVVAELAAGAQS